MASRACSSNPARRGKSFPRECRLLRRAEFEAVYRSGRRRASKQFVIFFLPHADSPATQEIAPRPSRFGASVKRALGNAVVRNRIRRCIREILRLHRQEISAGWDIVIHPRSSVATAAFAPLEEELVQLILAATAAATDSRSESTSAPTARTLPS